MDIDKLINYSILLTKSEIHFSATDQAVKFVR